MAFEEVIGFEVHVEPITRSKMFCRCSADYFGAKPNTHTCPVCLGLPGAMPVPNTYAIDQCIKLGLALECEIRRYALFERKHYFYPDLPKGFQISQYKRPFCINGILNVNKNTYCIQRVHMEEDTAKMIHQGSQTLLDFNRSGVPLIEIVSAPVFHSPADVRAALIKLQQIIRYAGVSSADMEKGTMRCEVNVSLRKKGDRKLPDYRTEIKNLNSFRVVERALIHEINRLKEVYADGKTPQQETRGWDERKGRTTIQRTKEQAHDYRYFPEPDIPPIHLSEDAVKRLQGAIPELPDASIARIVTQYGVSEAEAVLLTESPAFRDFFEAAVKISPPLQPQIKTWCVGQLRRRLHEGQTTIDQTKLEPAAFVELLVMIDEGTITQATAKDLLPTMMREGIMPKTLVEKLGVGQVSDEKRLRHIVAIVLRDNPKAVEDYKAGKENAKYFLLGQVQRTLKGKADVNIVTRVLDDELSK